MKKAAVLLSFSFYLAAWPVIAQGTGTSMIGTCIFIGDDPTPHACSLVVDVNGEVGGIEGSDYFLDVQGDAIYGDTILVDGFSWVRRPGEQENSWCFVAQDSSEGFCFVAEQ